MLSIIFGLTEMGYEQSYLSLNYYLNDVVEETL